MSVAKSPLVVLTYHRVVPPGDIDDFYDVGEDAFEAQVEAVAARNIGAEDGCARFADGRRVCFTFDDGTADHFRAAEILAKHGLTGTFFVITGSLDLPAYLTKAQTAEMARAGHRIGSHTVSHRHLPKLSETDLGCELTESKKTLEDLCGYEVDWFAPPGGVYVDDSVRAAREAGYKVFRTMDWGYGHWPLEGRADCLPVFRSYDMAGFERLLDGRAPLWKYKAKNVVKRLLPDGLYNRVRNATASLIGG